MQETRKDPRAKVLSMTVRYKSATLDEFIEHHSHDISRGGMFIKTPAPFPGGTLLKFEVRIAEEQKVVQGVGRVVWKRDAASASPDTPAGMGVKFIKLDDESKQLIDRLILKRGSAEGAYDAGERHAADHASTSPQPAASGVPTENRPIPIRKGTMIGLGAMKPGSAPAPATPDQIASAPKTPPPPAASSESTFFPKSEPLVQPPREDQTVMRQAAELLRDAIREAGGSLDELGTAGASPVVAAPEPDSGRIIAPVPMLTGDLAKKDSAPPASTLDSAPPAAKTSSPPVSSKTEAAPVSGKPVSARSPASIPPASTGSRRPLPRSPAVPPDSRHPPAQTGSKSGVWMLIGVAALGGGIFFFAQRNKPEATPPEPSSTPAVVAPPTPEPSAAMTATPEPIAEPSASAAPPETAAEKATREKAEAEAAKKAEAAAKQVEADAKKAEAEAKKAADAEAKKAAAAEAKKAAAAAKQADLDAKRAAMQEQLKAARVAAAAHAATVMKPAPKPPAVTPTVPSDETPAPTAAPAPTEKAAPAPTTTAEKPAPTATVAPTATAAPTASAKPKPTPAPAAPKGGESDNPY
ncbi:MAG TPA: TIGR02266 family protein [Polyangiaceae bacterium]|nr:TIGR02266 family protein [Polyangiaceae bacterium]